ncbi:hypothetical protein OESDEN_04762, partial [Oesophagostomum dentatum]
LRREEEMRKAAEEEEKKDEDEEDAVETAKSDEDLGARSGGSDDDVASETHTAANYSEDEENANRKETPIVQEQWVHPKKLEQKKNTESSSRNTDNEPPQENDPSIAAPVVESEERRRRSRDEHRQTRGPVDKKGLPLPVIPRRREETKKVPAKPLEPGMMMTETNVLDRINKEMESLSSRNRASARNRSPDEPATSSKSVSSVRIPKRETPVDYAEVLFSNAPVIKRTPPTPEKKRNLVIASGLTTDSPNQLVFSKAHSSRLGMFLDKVGDKHRKLMLERDIDSEISSPFYEDSDRNGARSPFGLPYPRQQSQKYPPQKRPLPASSLDSYLGSPVQSSPDIRDGESTSSRPMGKKPKIDLSRMPDIIDKLYSNK